MATAMKRQAKIEAERKADRAARFSRMTERELVATIARMTGEIGAHDHRIIPFHSALIAVAREELASRRTAVAS